MIKTTSSGYTLNHLNEANDLIAAVANFKEGVKDLMKGTGDPGLDHETWEAIEEAIDDDRNVIRALDVIAEFDALDYEEYKADVCATWVSSR